MQRGNHFPKPRAGPTSIYPKTRSKLQSARAGTMTENLLAKSNQDESIVFLENVLPSRNIVIRFLIPLSISPKLSYVNENRIWGDYLE